MNFTFTEDQLLLQSFVREFITGEVTPQRIRQGWETPERRDDRLWQELAELGLTAATVPEAYGGLGMDEVDYILLAQECGYAALPEPLVNTALIAVPLLADLGGALAAEWLPKVVAGEARVIVGLEQNLVVEDAHIADLLLLERNNALFALTPDQVTLTANESIDRSRRLFSVEIASGTAPAVTGNDVPRLTAEALNRGALGCAAQSLGLAQRMIDLSVAYTADRKQFGLPIGSFQAVKHLMANVAVRLEYARAPVHRAAYAMACRSPSSATAVSHAKLVACEAATLAAKNSLQVHGAMGYAWEVDLHIYMKRAWALANTWGTAGFHKTRIGEHIFSEGTPLGPGATL